MKTVIDLQKEIKVMNNTIKIIDDTDFEVQNTEKCVMCDVDTNVPISMHIDFRTNYIEGAGQLCRMCASDIDNKLN